MARPNDRDTLHLSADPPRRTILYDCAVVRTTLRDAWNEPRVPTAPIRVSRDRVLIGLYLLAAALELALRNDAGWAPSAIAASFVLAAAMYWRRTHPLTAMAIAFGSVAVLDIVSRLVADQPLEFYTSAVVLIIPYALFRWGSGREALIGLGLMFAMYVFSITISWTGVGDAIGGLIVMLFPAALGALVRYQDRNRKQALEEVKLREREQLARELHDTVAHHVSAIAIQAQAGRAVATSDLGAAMDMLTTIEDEASRTLAEMRAMVTTLRGDADLQLAPQAGIDDIERLAETAGSLQVRVERVGDLSDVRPSIEAAVFRLAQESITNAARHARNASEVVVQVSADPEVVRLDVTDDGDVRTFGGTPSEGYGLIGMTERAHLLGGSLHAGPNRHRGWTVSASLPRHGASR